MELLKYDPESGLFTWINGPGFRRDLDGTFAGDGNNGRVQIMVDGKNHRAHRLAFLYMTGKFPNGEVDHIDCDSLNNRWNNLRDVNRTTNQQNLRRAHADNKCGFLGVYKKRNKYQSRIYVNGKTISLGCFDSPEEAHNAYVIEKRKLHEGCTL